MLRNLHELSRDVENIVGESTLHEVKLPSYLRAKIKDKLLGGKLTVNSFTSYSKTSSTNFALLPNQHFRFAVLLYEMAFEIKKYFEVLDVLRTLPDSLTFCNQDADVIEEKVRQCEQLANVLDGPDDFRLFSEFIRFTPEKEKNTFRLNGKSIFNRSETGKVSIRANDDCFGSIILSQINVPNSSSSIFGALVYSLTENKELYDELRSFFTSQHVPHVHSEVACTSVSKPFLLLAGISGTGKSRFVRKQAEAQGSEQEFFQLVPVRPDWHEPSDLLGYVSRINGSPKFVVTDALRFMVRAWKATGAEVITLPNGKTGWCSTKTLDEINTYWLCLDEMNLAPVEQYFADYLSVIESRQWLAGQELADSGNDFVYHCLPILPASSLVVAHDQTELAKDLGLDIQTNQADAQLWQSFTKHGIPVPFNLVVAGTVNMDETTHGFSRKVIDRALTIDFGRFFPNDFNQLWAPQTKPKTLGFSRLSHASKDTMANCPADPTGQKTIQFLQAVNKVLADSPFELAYRALNELLLAAICHNPQTDLELQAVWDDFLMCKVLPRIEGDDEKLSLNASNTAETLLDALAKQLSASFDQIWDAQRPDLLRENIAASTPLTVPCRSKQKIEWMKNRLERNSFTSFWP